MTDQITYTDKQLGQANPLPEEKKYTFQNANMVKNVVNSNADAFKDATKTWVNVNGNDGTGEVGNFFSPFLTPTAAAIAIRAALPTNPMMVIQKGTYVGEDLLFADGILFCEPGVTLQTGDNNAMFENIDGNYDGIDYQVVGEPDLLKVGLKQPFEMGTPLNSFKVSANNISGFMLLQSIYANNITFYANELAHIFLQANHLDLRIKKVTRLLKSLMVDDSGDVNRLGVFNILVGGIFSIAGADGFNITSSTTNKGTINFNLGSSDNSANTSGSFITGNADFNVHFVNHKGSGNIVIGGIDAVNYNISGLIDNSASISHSTIKIFDNTIATINLNGLILKNSNFTVIDCGTPIVVDVSGMLTMLTTADPKVGANITLNRISEPDQIPIAGQNMSINLANPHSPIFNSETVTTAGSIVRVWFTGDEETTTTQGTFYLSNGGGKGAVAEAVQVINVNDNIKLFYPQDVLGSISTILETIHAGTYTSFLSAKVSLNGGEQRFTIELYLTDSDGLPFDSPDVTQPIGDLGVRILALLDSGKIDMQSGNETQVNLSGSIPNQVEVPIGSRVRYHVSGEKIGTAAGAVNLSLYYGSDYNSYLDAPVTGMQEVKDDLTPQLGGDLETQDKDVIIQNPLLDEVGRVGTLPTDDGVYIAHTSEETYDPNDGALELQAGKVRLHGSAASVDSLQGGDNRDVHVAEDGTLYAAPFPDEGWEESDTSTATQQLLGLQVWYAIADLVITIPQDVAIGERLDITTNLWIQNFSGVEDGSIGIGYGINATPPASVVSVATIGNGFAGMIPISFSSTNHGGLTAGDTITVNIRRESESNAQFDPWLSGALGTHGLFVGIQSTGIEEAPIDGLIYGRKDGAWVAIP